MSTIDNRIVQMQFDNKQFEKNIGQTMKSLDQLDKQLDPSKFKSVKIEAPTIDFSKMESAVLHISDLFSRLSSISTIALSKIKQGIVDTAFKVTKALVINPKKMGLSEYETKMNSIAVIKANVVKDEKEQTAVTEELTERELELAKAMSEGRYGNGTSRRKAIEDLGEDYDKLQNVVNKLTKGIDVLNVSEDEAASGTGTTLADINKALDELNEYSDRTIYNFAEMTDNIGKFTAAGVGLEDSVTSIKGLANVAALAGVNATRMAGATYQISQALPRGFIKWEDWKSMQYAGMGGQFVQDAMIESARELGIEVDSLIEKNGSFQDSLKSGWLTTEVFVTAMRKFTDEETELGKKAYAAATDIRTFTMLIDTLKESLQSGWSKTWELIIGNSDEAIHLFTGINNAIAPVITAFDDYRNSILKLWHDAEIGGRSDFIKGLSAVWNYVKSIFEVIGEAFKETFSDFPDLGDLLSAITIRLRNLAQSLTLSEDSANIIRKVFSLLFQVIKFGLKIVGSFLGFGTSLFEKIAVAGKDLLDILKGVNSEFDRENAVEKFKKNYGIIGKIVVFVQNAIHGLSNSLNEIGEGVRNSDAINKLAGTLKTFGLWISSKGSKVFSNFSKAYKDAFGSKSIKFSSVVIGVIDTLANVINYLLESIPRGIFQIKEFISVLFGITSGDLTNSFDKMISGIKDVFSSKKDILGSIRNFFNNLFDVLKTGIAKVVSFLKNSGIVDLTEAFVLVWSVLQIGKTFKAARSPLDSLSKVFDSIKNMFGNFMKVTDAMAFSIKADAIVKMAEAVGIVSTVVLVLGKIPTDQLINGLFALTVIAMVIKGLVNVYGRLSEIGKKDPLDEIAKNVTDTTQGFLGSLTQGVLTLLKGLSQVIKIASMLVAVSASVFLVAQAIKTIASIDQKQFRDAVLSISIIAGTISVLMFVFSKLGKNTDLNIAKNILAMSAVLTSVGTAIFAIAESMRILSNIGNMRQAIGGILAVSTIVIALSYLTSKIPMGGDLKTAIGVLSVATGLTMSILSLAGAIYLLGNISTNVLWKGVGAIAAVSAIVSLMSAIVGSKKFNPSNLLIFSASLIAFSAAITVVSLSAVSAAVATPVLLALAIAIAAVGVAGKFLGPGITTAADGFLKISVGVLALSGALAVLGISLALIADKLPAIGEGLGALSMLIVQYAPYIFLAIVTVLSAVELALLYQKSKIAKTIMIVVSTLISAVVSMTPEMLEGLRTIFFKIIDFLSVIMYDLVDALVLLIIRLIDALAHAIERNKEALIGVIKNVILALGNLVLEAIQQIVGLVTDKFDGVFEFFQKNLTNNFYKMEKSTKKSLGGLTDSASGDAKDSGKSIATAFASGLGSATKNAGGMLSSLFSVGSLGADQSYAMSTTGYKSGTSYTNAIADGVTDAGIRLKASLVGTKNILDTGLDSDETTQYAYEKGFDSVMSKYSEASKKLEDVGKFEFPSIDSITGEIDTTRKEKIAETKLENLTDPYERAYKRYLEIDEDGKVVTEDIQKWYDDAVTEYGIATSDIISKYNELAHGEYLYRIWSDINNELKSSVSTNVTNYDQTLSELINGLSPVIEETKTKYADLLKEVGYGDREAEDFAGKSVDVLAYSINRASTKLREAAESGEISELEYQKRMQSLIDWTSGLNLSNLYELTISGQDIEQQINEMLGLPYLGTGINRWRDEMEQYIQDKIEYENRVKELDSYVKDSVLKNRVDSSDHDWHIKDNPNLKRGLDRFEQEFKSELLERTSPSADWDIPFVNVTKAISNFGDRVNTETSNELGTSSGSSTITKGYGENYISGFERGVENKKFSALVTVSQFCGSVNAVMRKAFRINSPSKITEEIGKYFVEGFSVGVENNEKNYIQKPLAVIKDYLENDFDVDPTIRPVVDMSEIQNASSSVNGLLSNSSRYSLGVDRVNSISRNLESRRGFVESTPTTNSSGSTDNSTSTNNFYITGSNPREIANEVDAILQRRADRRRKSWA